MMSICWKGDFVKWSQPRKRESESATGFEQNYEIAAKIIKQAIFE